MATFSEIAEVMRESIETAVAVQQAFDATPETDDATPLLRWYPVPGRFTPSQHMDKLKRWVWEGSHSIVWLYVFEPEDEATAIEQGCEVLWQMTIALLGGMARDQFKYTVSRIGEISVQEFGWAEDNADKRFFVALEVPFVTQLAIDGGRRDGR